MEYVLDTNTISQMYRFYYRDRFPSFWMMFNDLIHAGRASSVSEVADELSRRSGLDVAIQDLKRLNSNFFTLPTHEEQLFIAQIFTVPHFHGLISAKARAKGPPVVDPYIIAKAGTSLGLCVVTEEILRPNAAAIPNVCQHFNVDSINLQQLMEYEGWQF